MGNMGWAGAARTMIWSLDKKHRCNTMPWELFDYGNVRPLSPSLSPSPRSPSPTPLSLQRIVEDDVSGGGNAPVGAVYRSQGRQLGGQAIQSVVGGDAIVGGGCRRRSQTPRLLCSACSPRIVTHSRRHWARFEVYTKPAGFLTKQATRSGIFTVHRQVRTYGHNTQQTQTLPTSRFPNGECSLQTKPSGTMIILPITATHSHLPITLQLALI